MSLSYKKVAVIGRQTTFHATKTLLALINHLKKRKVKVFLESDTAKLLSENKTPIVLQKDLKRTCDLIVAIGGDGSLLTAARISVTQSLPVVGINRGYLGFLTDIKPGNISKIDKILTGSYLEERRFLLKASIYSGTKKLDNCLALNDVAFFSSKTGHMIEFSVYVDEGFLCNYRSDGLIIATPTGSTAHALSSGGPILHPSLENIVIVPVLSHNISSRPIVISSKSRVKVTFAKNNMSELLMLSDGQARPINNKSTIKITKAPGKLRLLHPTSYDYFETLRTKLNWERKNKGT